MFLSFKVLDLKHPNVGPPQTQTTPPPPGEDDSRNELHVHQSTGHLHHLLRLAGITVTAPWVFL